LIRKTKFFERGKKNTWQKISGGKKENHENRWCFVREAAKTISGFDCSQQSAPKGASLLLSLPSYI
jgi:hypothetical protein